MAQKPIAEKPTEAAFRSLIRVCGLLDRLMQPYFARFGISGAQWGILRTLYRAEREGMAGLRMTDLSDRLLVRPPSITGVVDRMQRMGLVSRDPSAVDLRTKQVSLTPAGRELLERILQGHGARVAALMEELDGGEQQQLRELLERLARRWGAMIEGEEAPPLA